MDQSERLTRRIRALLLFFIICLVLSGLTAFPLNAELGAISRLLDIDPQATPDSYNGLWFWIATVAEGLRETSARYPFIAYGTDWLAFGHIIIALMFVGPLRDPVKNIWVIQAGLIACVGVIPLALIAGQVRQVPFYWRLIDCSFGVVGFIPLWLCLRYVNILRTSQKKG